MRKTVAKQLNKYAAQQGWQNGTGRRLNLKKQLKRDYNKLPHNQRAAFLQEIV